MHKDEKGKEYNPLPVKTSLSRPLRQDPAFFVFWIADAGGTEKIQAVGRKGTVSHGSQIPLPSSPTLSHSSLITSGPCSSMDRTAVS
jgi:hypothetical protein